MCLPPRIMWELKMPGIQFKEKIFDEFRSGTQTNKKTNKHRHTRTKKIEIKTVKLTTSTLKFSHCKTAVLSRKSDVQITKTLKMKHSQLASLKHVAMDQPHYHRSTTLYQH